MLHTADTTVVDAITLLSFTAEKMLPKKAVIALNMIEISKTEE